MERNEFIQLRREVPRHQGSLAKAIVMINGPEAGKYIGSGKWHVTIEDSQEEGIHIPGAVLEVKTEESEEHVWISETEGGSRRLVDDDLERYRFHFASKPEAEPAGRIPA